MKNMEKGSLHFLQPQNRADILRLVLMYENGGMWLDSNSFFINDFSWIENIQKEASIINRIGTYPDHLAFTFHPYGGNKTKVWDE